MPLQLVTAPIAEPLSLIEAKQHLRVIGATDEDAVIARLIRAARAYAEQKCQRQIMAATWKLVLDSFPGTGLMGIPFGRTYGLPPHAIVLPKAPVLQVDSITYIDMGGITQTLVAGTDYIVDASADPVRITPPFGAIWKIPQPRVGSVAVTFRAGDAQLLTANTGANTIKAPNWKTLNVGDTLRVSNRDKLAVGDGTLPAPLASYTDYQVASVAGTDTYTLAGVALTSVGAGESFVGTIPEGLVQWMLLSLATLYENREAVMVDTRISSAELPLEFLDGLLDPYRLVLY